MQAELKACAWLHQPFTAIQDVYKRQWYDFATAIFAEAVALGHSEYDSGHLTVAPVTTAEYGISKAARPFNSRLDKHKLVENGFTPLPTWQDALKRYLTEIL